MAIILRWRYTPQVGAGDVTSLAAIVGPRGLGIASSAWNATTGILTITYTDATVETLDLSGTFTARDAAIAAQAAAEAAQTAAEAAEANAETAETNAAASASAAATSEANAATSATAAASSATAAAASAAAAGTSETNAAASASAASASATAAATSETNAATSETNAVASASAASTSETNAAASETAAAASETAAGTSETNAAASAAAASTSEANAAASAAVAETARDAAQALVNQNGVVPLFGEILWPATDAAPQYFSDTGLRLLSGTSQRAILVYLGDIRADLFEGGTIDGFALDFTDDATVFSDTAGTTPADPGDSLARVNDVSGNDINSTQANVAFQGKYGKAPKVVRNLLVNTATLSTQSRTVTAVSHTLSFTGTGTVTLSGASTAGPLVGTGASDRVSLTFTPTAGTLTLTVSGAVTSAQLEIGALSNYQAVGATNLDVTESGVESFGSYRPGFDDDVLPLTVPAIDGDILLAGGAGTWIEPVTISAGAFNIGPTTYTGGTPGILRAVCGPVSEARLCGVELIDKTLSASERERIIRYYQGRGAKGLLVPGPELVTNGGFDADLTGWSHLFPARGAFTWEAGTALIDNSGTGNNFIEQQFSATVGALYLAQASVVSTAATSPRLGFGNLSGSTASNQVGPTGVASLLRVMWIAQVPNPFVNFLALGGLGAGAFVEIDNISVRELRPEEDW